MIDESIAEHFGRPPKLIKPYVSKFARQVVKGADPVLQFVPCRPAKGMAYNECFPFVDAHVAQYGGSAVLGWAIWERPKILIEAEFHAVWQTPSGDLVDIVPRDDFAFSKTLFLLEPSRKYQGFQVNNVRKALSKDKDIDRFIALNDERFRIMNEGKLKHQSGMVTLSGETAVRYERNLKELEALDSILIKRYVKIPG